MEKENRVTLSGRPPVDPDAPAPDMTVDQTGMHRDYWVLSPDERAKGFVRPVRLSYRHVGPPGPVYPLRDLSPEELERYAPYQYIKFEDYPPSDESSVTGRFWTQDALDKVKRGGCGTVTTMHRDIAETYARDPHAYGSTFCVRCGRHLPVGKTGEFVWEGTDERVGT